MMMRRIQPKETRPTMTGFVNKMQEVGEIRNVKKALLALFGVGQLRIINLRGNCITGILDDIINGIILNKPLEKLYLGNNGLYVPGLSEENITKLFKNCQNLRHLDLSNNNLDDECISGFIQTLERLSDSKDPNTAQFYVRNLEYLNLENNEITKMKQIYKFSRLHGNVIVACEGNEIDGEEFERMKSVIGETAIFQDML